VEEGKMNKKIFVVLMVSLFLMSGLLMTQGITIASSRPLMGFTLTPEQPTVAPPTPAPTAVPATPVPKEPKEPSGPVVLPVTGEEFISAASVCYSAAADGPVRFVNFPAHEAYIPVEEQSSQPAGRVTRIVIPSLSVDARVKMAGFIGNSWDVEDLGRNLGWLQNTSLPGLGGNTVVAGHATLFKGNLGPFYNLNYIQPGAKVYVYTGDDRLFVYQMRERIIVQPTDLSVTQNSTAAQLTLLTCSHWDQEKKEYLRRVAIVADLVSYKDLGSK
jgi:LPXTG-site transpeptidase (sortase) family protein